MNFQRTTCACTACVQCCKSQPGSLAPGDFERIAAYLHETPETATHHFVASAGALVMDLRTNHQRRIGTITPKTVNRKGARDRCTFLGPDDRCQIHEVAPAGCAYFDTHMADAEGNRRSNALAHAQLDERYQTLRRSLPFATTDNRRRNPFK